MRRNILKVLLILTVACFCSTASLAANTKAAYFNSTGYDRIGNEVTVTASGNWDMDADLGGWRLKGATNTRLSFWFQADSTPTDGTLFLEHLSSTASGYTLGGRSFINIYINGYYRATWFDPGSAGYHIDQLNITKFLKSGWNYVYIVTTGMTTHYWIKSIQVDYSLP